ncbi:hypothetical protein AZE42_12970 [Rhizopogon vesiculosus]|uniref:Uncharacterized protein n=1 Tax=Rhizopogon vesiculosus TaxID=180088 RepID=A0A1J8QB33_9AGAM|nr:hypothetical protein AZE42_12970 [Rhizopogon vesiculosus]
MMLTPSNSTMNYRSIQTPESRHLIFNLIACDWHAKLACVNRTLPDAVCEYHRRFTDCIAPWSTASTSKETTLIRRPHLMLRDLVARGVYE